MTKSNFDLISIANKDLAEKLSEAGDTANAEASGDNTVYSTNTSDPSQKSFDDDVFKAVYTLNIIRYVMGLSLISLLTYSSFISEWGIISKPVHPTLFFVCVLTLLLSAILFSHLSQHRNLSFDVLVTSQLSIDVTLATLIIHSAGGLNSNFMLLYFVVVASGSVVLHKRQALGLASGTVILMFSEHFYSRWFEQIDNFQNLGFLANYAIALLFLGLLLSYLASQIRASAHKNYVPGTESIEDYLLREETAALRSALEVTQGNKTEAAKLLGLSFRSLRYKLTKFGIE